MNADMRVFSSMNKFSRLGALLLVASFLLAGGCTTSHSDASKPAKPAAKETKENPAVFERVMKTFVDRATRGDVEGMVSLTSKVTIAQMGLEPLKQHYVNDVVTTLKAFPKMTGGGRADPVDDGKGTAGWVFKKVFSGVNGEEAKVQFIVLKEQGRIGVGYVGSWK